MKLKFNVLHDLLQFNIEYTDKLPNLIAHQDLACPLAGEVTNGFIIQTMEQLWIELGFSIDIGLREDYLWSILGFGLMLD